MSLWDIKKVTPEAFIDAILWMKNAARNKQILSAPGFVTKSSRYKIKKTIFKSESEKKNKNSFYNESKKGLAGYFLDIAILKVRGHLKSSWLFCLI